MDEQRYRDAEQRMWESVGVQPTERRLELERVGTTVRVQEVGDGPTVLFVHGATTAGASWASLVARLPHLRCVVLDRPGCGLSDTLADRFTDIDSLGAFADSLIIDVLDTLEVTRSLVVATSFGGYLALRTAAAHADRIDTLMLLGWAAGASHLPFSVRLASVPGIGRLMAAAPINPRAVRALLPRIGLGSALTTGRFTPAMLDWYVSLLRDTDTLRNEMTMGPTFPLLHMDDRMLLPDDVLRRVLARTYCLWGVDDPFGDAEVARRLVAVLSDAELELVPRAGHAPWIDEPDLAASWIRALLTE